MSGKMTAVDLFHDLMVAQLAGKKSITTNSIAKAWLECKAMERQQIEDAYCHGVIDGAGEVLNRDSIKPDAVKYYEDNHGKEAHP